MTRVQTFLAEPQPTRLLVAGVLLTAAALKWTISALVVVEIVLGLWLLSGWQWRVARWFAIAWTIALCGVALYKADSGATSCDCFGRVQVNPWLTFALDVSMVAALLLCTTDHHTSLRIAQFAILGIAAATPFSSRPPLRVQLSMKPEDWVGQDPWSLGPYVDRWTEISRGKWAVLLYDPDCRACAALRDSYEQLATNWKSQKLPQRVALIDPTLSADTAADTPSEALYGALREPHGWYTPTPTLVILIDGRVVETNFGFDECAWNEREFPDH